MKKEGKKRGPGAGRRELTGDQLEQRGLVWSAAAGLFAMLSTSCGPSTLLTEPLAARHKADAPTGAMAPPSEPAAQKKKAKRKAASEEAAVAQPEAAAPKRPPSPFSPVLEGAGSVVRQGGDYLWYGEDHIYNLTDNELVQSCRYLSGVPLEGKSLWFASKLNPFSACPGDVRLTKFRGDRFAQVRPLQLHDMRSTVWKAGVTLAAEVPYRSGPPWGYELRVLEGGGMAPLVTKGPRVSPYPGAEPVNCYSTLQRPQVLHGFPSGELLVVGQGACGLGEEQDNRVTVEYWDAGKRRGRIVSAPLDELLDVAVLSPSAMYFLGRHSKNGDYSEEGMERLLLRFDGASWKEIARGNLETPTSLVVFGSGDTRKLWGQHGARIAPLLEGSADEEQREYLPEGCASVVSAWSQENVRWLHCEQGLYSTAGKAIELPAEASECPVFLEKEPSRSFGRPHVGKKQSPGGCGGRVRPTRVPSSVRTKL